MKLKNISTVKLFKYSRLLLSIIILIIILFIGIFLYKNLYKTITQSEELMILQREVAIEDINMANFDKIIEKINIKTKPRNIKLNLNF